MRLWSFLKKSLRENLRDWKMLVTTLVLAPIMLFIMYIAFGSTSQSYHILVSDFDRGVAQEDGRRLTAGEDLVNQMKEAKYPDGKPMLKISLEKDKEKAENKIKDRAAEIWMVIPENFSQALQDSMVNKNAPKAKLTMTGDMSNLKYVMAAVLVDTFAYEYISLVTATDIPVEISRESVDNSRTPTQFELMVPGMLALAVISLLFTAAASVIKEVDKGTIRRIKISRIKPFEFLGAVGICQAVISIPAIALTYASALSVGYKPVGSFILILFIGVLSSFSIMAISLIVASFISSIYGLMTVGCLPFFILMFFSGGMLPLPSVVLFHIGNHAVDITGVLPTSHTFSAMNKILNYGSGLGEVGFEICAILLLTLVYSAAGVLLFKRKHLRAV